MAARGAPGLVRELQRSHQFVVGVLLWVLVLSLLTSGYLLRVSQPRITDLVDIARSARVVHEGMLDQEAGLRAWLATGDDTFLDRYRDGRRHDAAITDRLIADVGRQGNDLSVPVTRLLIKAERWQGWASRAIATRLTAGERVDGTLRDLLAEDGRLFGDYRASFERGIDLILHQRDQAIDDQTRTLVTVLLLYLTGIALTGAATLVRRRRLRNAVLVPIQDLHATVGRLRSGDLGARAPKFDLVELDEIGTELSRLADDLIRAGDEAAFREEALALTAHRFAMLVQIGREIAGSLDVRYVSATVTTAAADLVGTRATLWVPGPGGALQAAHRTEDDETDPTTATVVSPPTTVVEAAEEASFVATDHERAYPLVLAGRVTGVLEIATGSVDVETEQVLIALLSTAAAALDSAHLHSAAREQADQDALTGLANRRRFESDVAVEWERCRRYGRPLSMVMLDLDHFKALNDEHGHLVGDHALRAAAAGIAGSLRATDTAFRYGGEEFVVLLRETTIEDAGTIADRLRRAVAQVEVPGSPEVALTTSAGVAARRSGMTQSSELVRLADEALYDAKRQGRNRVCRAGEQRLLALPMERSIPA